MAPSSRPWAAQRELDDAVAVLLGATPSAPLDRPAGELVKNAIATALPASTPVLLRMCEELRANGKLAPDVGQALRDRLAFHLRPPSDRGPQPPIGDATVGGKLTRLDGTHYLAAWAGFGPEMWIKLVCNDPEAKRILEETPLTSWITVTGKFELPGHGIVATVEEITKE